jgi:hypothetical protein
MFTASAELDVRDGAEQPSPSLPLTVRTPFPVLFGDGPLT